MRQPTMVNVVRDPTDWFVSQYYFRRYGWEREKANRNSFIGSEEDRERVSLFFAQNFIQWKKMKNLTVLKMKWIISF